MALQPRFFAFPTWGGISQPKLGRRFSVLKRWHSGLAMPASIGKCQISNHLYRSYRRSKAQTISKALYRTHGTPPKVAFADRFSTVPPSQKLRAVLKRSPLIGHSESIAPTMLAKVGHRPICCSLDLEIIASRPAAPDPPRPQPQVAMDQDAAQQSILAPTLVLQPPPPPRQFDPAPAL